MRATAVICIRDDDAYVEGCLRHLITHGIDFAVLDNGMGPEARALLGRAPFRDHLHEVRPLAFNGAFELERQIEAKERMFEGLDADWLIHLDVDEVMHSYVPEERLIDAIARIDAGGFNVINFDEYVFLPLEQSYQAGACPQPLRAYYLFDPGIGPRLMRARRRSANLSMAPARSAAAAAGHRVYGDDVRLAAESFVLRHYIFRDQDHAWRKYTERVYAPGELQRGWHANRAGRPATVFDFPPPETLKRLPTAGSHAFDRSDPKRKHYWDWPSAPVTPAADGHPRPSDRMRSDSLAPG